MIHILVVDDDKNLNQTVCSYLNDKINSIYTMVDLLSEEELFKPHMRK